MRMRIWKRIAATALTVVMLVTLLPTAAYAAISATIDASDKAAILAELTAITGNQADAEALYARLNALGVLDGDQWVTEDLVINGETYTLDEAWDLVGSLSDDEIVQVGNTNLTVADLRIMLEIEEEIIRIRDLYFNGEDWTPEQQANINLLQEALDNGDFVVDNAGSTLGQSGIDHGARVNVSGPQVSGNTATFTVELTGAAENQTVTFDYQAVSGSQTVSGSGEGVELTSANPSVELSVALDTMSTDDTENPVRATADLVYYLNFSNLTNALFENGRSAMSLECTTDGTTNDFPALFSLEETFNFVAGGASHTSQDFTLTEVQQQAVLWGLADTAVLSQTTYTAAELAEGNENMIKIDDSVPDNLATFYRSVRFSADIPYSGALTDPRTITGFYGYTSSNGNFIYEKTEPSPLALEGDIGASVWLSGSNMMPGQSESGSSILSDPYSLDVKLDFTNDQVPSVESVTAPAGTYYAGQTVPVTVTFSEPVTSGSATINGEPVTAALTGGASNVVVFPYEVEDIDSTQVSVTSISATDMADNTLSNYNPNEDAGTGLILSGVQLPTSLDVNRAVADLSVSLANPGPADTTVTVTATMRDGYETVLAQRGLYLYASTDGGQTFTELTTDDEGETYTCQLTIGQNTAEQAKNYQVELYIGSSQDAAELYFGQIVSFAQSAAVYLDANDFSITATNFPDADETIYADHEETLSVAISVTGTESYTYATTSNPDHFRWGVEIQDAEGQWTTVGADQVASVVLQNNDPVTGTIVLLGTSGTFRVTLTASNGGWDTAEGQVGGPDVTVYSPAVEVGIGNNPTLTIAPAIRHPPSGHQEWR